MDLLIVKCPLCDDLIRLVNCPHTNPECPWRSPLMPLGWILPLTHDINPTTTVSEDKSSDTDESEEEKTAKKTKKLKLSDTLKKINQDKFHLKSLTHQCPKIRNLRSKPTARKSIPKWLLTELNTPSTVFGKLFPTSRIVDIIELMINQMENVQVLMGCHRLFDRRCSPRQLNDLESQLRRDLVEVLLSVVKRHCHDSLIVETFCQFLFVQVNIGRGETDCYLGSIDCLLKIFCRQNNMTPTAKLSAARLFESITVGSEDKNLQNLIGDKSFVENICQSIGFQLNKSDYYMLDISWRFLSRICRNSVRNRKRFVDAGGISLFQRCYEKFPNKPYLIGSMTSQMMNLSEEKSLRPDLMANGNLADFMAILWQIWNETDGILGMQIRFYCSTIFTNFLDVLRANWPLGHPTIEEVKSKLDDLEKANEYNRKINPLMR